MLFKNYWVLRFYWMLMGMCLPKFDVDTLPNVTSFLPDYLPKLKKIYFQTCFLSFLVAFVTFGLVFMKDRKLKVSTEKTKKIISIKLTYSYCLSQLYTMELKLFSNYFDFWWWLHQIGIRENSIGQFVK